MDNKYECKICGKKVTANNSYIGSHVKRIHNILLEDYFLNYENEFTNLNPDFKILKCNFCKQYDAVYKFEVNYKDKTFIRYYDGYFCRTNICKEQISKDILNTPYNVKTFEHIGANSLFLSIKHNKQIKDVKFKKSKGFRELNFTTSLEGYIIKYGNIIGTKKYKERCKKISKANTKKWYLEKYGNEEGEKKWDIFRKKKHKAFGPSKSKKSNIINKILEQNNIKYIDEYKYENKNLKNGSIDFYLPDLNIAIEYYGDYWHCNPTFYNKDYFHKICKQFATEIWEKDKNRINYIFETEFKKIITILIIWESTKFTPEYLINKLNEIKNLNTIIEI